MSIKRIGLIAKLDLVLALQTPIVFVFLLVMPVAMVFFLGTVMQDMMEPKNNPTFEPFVVAVSHTEQADTVDLLQAVFNDEGLGRLALIQTDDVQEAVKNGQAKAGLLITADENRSFAPMIVVPMNENPTLEESIVYMSVMNFASSLPPADISRIDERSLAPVEELSTFTFFSVNMLIFFLLASGMGIGSGLIDERNQKLFQRIHTFPIRKSEYLLGKSASSYIIAIVQAAAIMVLTHILFGVSWSDSIIGLAFTVCTVALIACAIGVLFSSFMSSSGGMTAVLTLVLWFMAFVSGGFTGAPLHEIAARFTIHHWAYTTFSMLISEGLSPSFYSVLIRLVGLAIVLWIAGSIAFSRRVSYV